MSKSRLAYRAFTVLIKFLFIKGYLPLLPGNVMSIKFFFACSSFAVLNCMAPVLVDKTNFG